MGKVKSDWHCSGDHYLQCLDFELWLHRPADKSLEVSATCTTDTWYLKSSLTSPESALARKRDGRTRHLRYSATCVNNVWHQRHHLQRPDFRLKQGRRDGEQTKLATVAGHSQQATSASLARPCGRCRYSGFSCKPRTAQAGSPRPRKRHTSVSGQSHLQSPSRLGAHFRPDALYHRSARR